jgi:homocysteine S-methyltransferase
MLFPLEKQTVRRPVLTEGAVIERLNRRPDISMDPALLNGPLIYDRHGRDQMAEIINGYIDIGRRAGLGLLVASSTWRASHERVANSAFRDRPVNRDGVAFVIELCQAAGPYASQLSIGGLMGPKGDAYRPEEALSADDAALFHQWQADELAAGGAQFLWAATLPALSEALGLARALSATGLPYIISFVIRPDGTLLDGTFLPDAMAAIDDHVQQVPDGYMINCVHPQNLAQALERIPQNRTGRLMGLQGNASAKSPEDLDGSEETDADNPNSWAEGMADLYRKNGLWVLGGCCGTDERHIGSLADRLGAAS